MGSTSRERHEETAATRRRQAKLNELRALVSVVGLADGTESRFLFFDEAPSADAIAFASSFETFDDANARRSGCGGRWPDSTLPPRLVVDLDAQELAVQWIEYDQVDGLVLVGYELEFAEVGDDDVDIRSADDRWRIDYVLRVSHELSRQERTRTLFDWIHKMNECL